MTTAENMERLQKLEKHYQGDEGVPAEGPSWKLAVALVVAGFSIGAGALSSMMQGGDSDLAGEREAYVVQVAEKYGVVDVGSDVSEVAQSNESVSLLLRMWKAPSRTDEGRDFSMLSPG
jgi:hypothetical protein